MNYKQKALDHVRGVCPELALFADLKGNVSHWDTPHLEHWLLTLSEAGKELRVYPRGQYLQVAHVNERTGEVVQHVVFDLTEGLPDGDRDYKAYCEIAEV